MARTLVDIPAEKLAAAQRHLGTTSKRATIEQALDLVNRRAAQHEAMRVFAEDEQYADWGPELLAKVRPTS